LGYDLIVDANFGNKTLRSIKAFQKKYGITQDGVVGDKTLTALKAAQKRTAKEDNSPLPSVDYEGFDIVTDCQIPDQQYVKQVTSKSQIFLHFTAGGGSAKNTINYWTSDATQVATAYVVDGDSGKVYQAFHPDYWGWHLGVKGTNGKLDKASIGIEICSYGPLVKKGSDFFAWPNNYSTKVNESNVYTLENDFRGYIYYYKYTDKQIENIEKLLEFLIKKYKIKVQGNFDLNWLEYNQELINKCLPGIWSHSNVRKDKFDTYPDKRLFEVLNRIYKKFN
jgi:peptidoglycan hydrolase-like protein with peptidoglycan-binding domain